MNAELFEEEIAMETLGKVTFHSEEYIRNTMLMPVLNAFLDDDDMYEITIKRIGASWIPTTFRKRYRNEDLQRLADTALMVTPLIF
jgi:hypothetical protein